MEDKSIVFVRVWKDINNLYYHKICKDMNNSYYYEIMYFDGSIEEGKANKEEVGSLLKRLKFL